MTYVIFHKETTKYLRIWRNRHYQDADFYKTERAAKSGLTRAAKSGWLPPEFNIDDYRILPSDEFMKIEKTETKINLLSGVSFEQSVNTPSHCDPSTETYHSM